MEFSVFIGAFLIQSKHKVIVVYVNTIETTFYLNFNIYQASKQHKHLNKEKLSINSFSICSLVNYCNWKVSCKALLLTIRHHSIDIIANHCQKSSNYLCKKHFLTDKLSWFCFTLKSEKISLKLIFS